jgi:hypothetical protein
MSPEAGDGQTSMAACPACRKLLQTTAEGRLPTHSVSWVVSVTVLI